MITVRWRELWTFLKLVCIFGLGSVWVFPIVVPWIPILALSTSLRALLLLFFLIMFGGPVAFLGSIILLLVRLSEENRGIIGFFVFVGSIGPVLAGLLLLAYIMRPS